MRAEGESEEMEGIQGKDVGGKTSALEAACKQGSGTHSAVNQL